MEDCSEPIKVGIIGAAGFAGIELVRVVLSHPCFTLHVATSNELAGKAIAAEYPVMTGATNEVFALHDDERVAECEVVFLAVPHTVALKFAPALVEAGKLVVDLSADFRLENPVTYERWYKTKHTSLDLLARRGFGLPELFPEDLKKVSAQYRAGEGGLVGCAGCYPTATSLAAAPAIRGGFMKEGALVVADAISGVTGAGKGANARTHFCSANETVEAYGVTTHRHTPEIEQILGLSQQLVFTPHLAPLNRGLHSTVTIPLADDAPHTLEEYLAFYKDFYKNSAFVHVLDASLMPKTSSVVGSNHAHIGLALNEELRVLICAGAIDNVGKGAADQAIQCANIVLGLSEDTGLKSFAVPVG